MKNRKLMTVLLLSLTLTAAGCSAAWLSTFDNYLQIAGPMLIQIIDIIAIAQGKPAPAGLVAKINADSAAVKAVAASVQAATSQNVQGTCGQFNLAVSTFASDLSSVEQLAQINDPTTQATVNNAVSIAQQALAEVEAPIAACQAAPTGTEAMARLRAGAYVVKSPEDCVKRFNAAVDPKHHIHLHSKLVRVITFGKLQ